jgi:hypothetical protein
MNEEPMFDQSRTTIPLLASALGINIFPRIPEKIGNGKAKQNDYAKKQAKRAAQAERCRLAAEETKGLGE